jgi:ribokinase
VRSVPTNAIVDVAVVGSLNVDLMARVRRHPLPGQTVSASALTLSAGGKGANQAVAAARLGARTAMVGRVGNDAHADTLLDSLRADGVGTTHTVRDTETPTGTALIAVSDSGENHIIVSAGANARVSSIDIDAARGLLTSARVVSLVLEIPVDTVLAAIHAAQGSARIVLNLSPVTELPTTVLALADPLIVNEHEAREVLQGHGISAEPGAEQARSLCLLGARSAVVTLGADGAAIADTGGAQHIAGMPVEVVDTTGAGDAFTAALAWRLSQGDALPDAAHYAIRVSAHSVGRHGAQSSYPASEPLPDPPA